MRYKETFFWISSYFVEQGRTTAAKHRLNEPCEEKNMESTAVVDKIPKGIHPIVWPVGISKRFVDFEK